MESATQTPVPVPPPVRDGWESECNTERAKVNVRWFFIVVLFGILLWMRRHDPVVAANVSRSLAVGIALSFALVTGLQALFLWRPRQEEIPRWFKYLTITCDVLVISVLIYYTGYTQSPFFFVYFVCLISNCLRYGLLVSLFVAACVNVCYVFTLGLAPPGMVQPSVLGGEGLKILAFWGVALYGGAVSARLRRQANQLRAYEETIFDLRAKLAAVSSPSSESESHV